MIACDAIMSTDFIIIYLCVISRNRTHMRGHVTGRVWRSGLLQTSKHDILSRSPDLAKLNPKCHNFVIICKRNLGIMLICCEASGATK